MDSLLRLSARLAVSGLVIGLVEACCTDAGCFTTLAVDVSGPDGSKPTAFSGAAFVGTSSATFSCPDQLASKPTPTTFRFIRCDPGFFSVGLDALTEDVEVVRVELDAGPDGRFSGQVAVRSSRFNPNTGLTCGPGCVTSKGDVVLDR